MEKGKWSIASVYVILVSIFLKILYVLSIPGPIIWGDELLYRKRAAEIFYMHTYMSSSYPPGYPLVISICFLFDNFYFTIQIINILLSVFGIIAVWKIVKLYANERTCFVSVLLISLLPWQYMNCARIMSENLFYPILMWTIYFFLKTLFMEEIKRYYCVGLGLMLACLHLTRHMAIVFLPFFAIFWLIEINDNGHYCIRLAVKKIIQGCFVIIGYAGLYGTWIVLRLLDGDGIEKALGINISNGIGSIDIKQYATFNSLMIFIALYVAYLVLCLLYIIPLFLRGIKQCIVGRIDKNVSKAGVLLVGLCLMAVMATIRHSWRSEYNYPNIQYIIGRYIIYIPVMLIIFSQIARDSCTGEDKRTRLIIYQIAETLLIFLSGQILVRGQFLGLRERFLESVNTQENFYIYYMYIPILTVSVIKGFVIFFRCKLFYKITDFFMAITLLIGCIYAFGYGGYETRGVFGRTLYELGQKEDLTEYDYIVNDTPATNLEFDIEFWLGTLDKPVVVQNYINEKEDDETAVAPINDDYYSGYHKIKLYDVLNSNEVATDEEKGIVICPSVAGVKELINCEYEGVEYGVYEAPIKKEIALLKSYPENIKCGEGFNVQDNGDSALVLETNLQPGLYDLYINGECYADFIVSDNGMGSALIGNEIYQTAGTLSVIVKSKEGSFWLIEECQAFEIQVLD